MRGSLRTFWCRLRALVGEESGQAMTEYASITTIMLLGGIGLAGSWPFTMMLFDGLQRYLDLYFYALNLAVG
jgi:Flp pilus assembly pilin Flp